MKEGAVIPPLIPRSDFIGLEDGAHLYCAAECPMLHGTAEAIADYTRQKSRAEAGRINHADVTRSCRSGLATFLNVAATDIALLGSASEGINAVGGLIDWRTGDNVVVNDLEFPSVVLPWMRLRDRGVDVRVVRHQNWRISTKSLLAAVDSRTRLVALSQISYINGFQHDVEAISRALRDTPTLLLLDVTQALGVLPVSANLADFVVCSTYKWLLGVHGLGVFIWNRRRVPDPQPVGIGWYGVESMFSADRYERYALREDASRFETGYLNFPGIYALNASVAYLLKIDPERLKTHVHDLGDRLISGLSALGLTVTSPTERARRGASVTFLHDKAAEIGAELAVRRVHVWAGDGRVRASTHAFNGSEDADRYLAELSDVLAKS
jgi:cysteine desulfurase / selenocysteine lyase